ncbi:conserved hypothetical protein [Beutenbergia cavernae DSM 12333]|uniref:Uncharacterized protein n=1 Tax=Beutenbergia cavernae (strain ATCC BAA-8 / DSM 12333 / CCUG 43141 / JCM 11478 / NBRC 16432 / NCIMB 13614 / HKI 0122) TaxID=471853 RepID=C5C1Q2_BEUC1|nr:hypothetical protein [Beutenbergia cavernae]ACQ79520.1 conserved hypothetical protein [Beutenbergia cavernae DSM 12333]
MRVYLPASARDLAAPDGPPVGTSAHAVTPALRAALPDEDTEGLELAALLAAADASIALVAERGDVPRRVVVAADVPDAEVSGEAPQDALPSAVVVHALPWNDVVSIHVDDADAREDVAAAAAGDDDAFERAAERDLLWFDVVERGDLAAELSG